MTRLGGRRHRHVGVVPVALDAQALELLALDVHPLLRKGAALGDQLEDRHVLLALALGAVLLLDLPLDGQAVAVPARHVVGIEAQHLLAARHHVLQDLVERGADVDVAVGVGRAVVEDELGPPLGSLPQAAVHAEPGPALQELGLQLGQARLHGEGAVLGRNRVALQSRAVAASGLVEVMGVPSAKAERSCEKRSECGVAPAPLGDRAYNSSQRGLGWRHGAVL